MGESKGISLVGVRVENLRGFEESSLRVDRDVTLLVGPNNSGKTSLLRMLDWALNGDISQFESDREVPLDAQRLLHPARSTRKRARRLTLEVKVDDGRRHRKFRCDSDGIAQLRIGLRVSPYPSLRLNLGRATRSEGGHRDNDAYELFRELRGATRFVLIPASRHAESRSFGRTVDRAISAQLADVGIPRRGRAGATRKTLDSSYTDLSKLAETLVLPLWEEVKQDLPSGLADTGSFTVESSSRELIEWVASRLRFSISTGSHDSHQVLPVDVGSGLQSVLELSIAQLESKTINQDCIVALEEPEAFLHPSAQRTLARKVFAPSRDRKIVSTHSPLMVEEATYGSTVIVQDHHFFEPATIGEEDREKINTALMTRYGAEMVFAKSVLLVEGEGDREFFEALRRRLASIDTTGLCDRLVVVPTGANTNFAPWIRLIRSYRNPARDWNPLSWIALFDADSPKQIRRAFKDSKVKLATPVLNSLELLVMANGDSDLRHRLRVASQLNERSNRTGVRVMVSPGDLEWTMLSAASSDTIDELSKTFGMSARTNEELSRSLGSKHCPSPKRSDAVKNPWLRGVIGRTLPRGELSDATVMVLQRWAGGAMDKSAAKALVATDF